MRSIRKDSRDDDEREGGAMLFEATAIGDVNVVSASNEGAYVD
jgi:hypothetical protein